MEVIEWRTDARRVLYLCSASGFPFDQVETRFHVPGFSFSAYLKSTYVEDLHNEERVALSEMDPLLITAVENARAAIKDYFRNKAAEKGRSLVEESVRPKTSIPIVARLKMQSKGSSGRSLTSSPSRFKSLRPMWGPPRQKRRLCTFACSETPSSAGPKNCSSF